MEKILIIKAGYSEILDKDDTSRTVSLGDVLRTTAILHLYKNDKVTWVTDIEAFPLLAGNPFIDRLLPYDLTTVQQLELEEFDTVINLEKVPGICALADKIRAWKKYGFRFNTQTGKAEAHEKAIEVLAVSHNPEYKKQNTKTVQELLFEMVGKKWENEGYILGYKPKSEEIYDVALNTQVGKKWPTKVWPLENWDKLEELLRIKGLKVTRQDKQGSEILKELPKYIDWINSAKIIITSDSLGLHLGIALKKNVIGLFGPTPHQEIRFHGKGKPIFPANMPECMPCVSQTCEKKLNPSCIIFISPEQVVAEIEKIIDSGQETLQNTASSKYY